MKEAMGKNETRGGSSSCANLAMAAQSSRSALNTSEFESGSTISHDLGNLVSASQFALL